MILQGLECTNLFNLPRLSPFRLLLSLPLERIKLSGTLALELISTILMQLLARGMGSLGKRVRKLEGCLWKRGGKSRVLVHMKHLELE